MKILKNGRATKFVILVILITCTSQRPAAFRQQDSKLDNPLLFALVVPPLTYNNFGHQLETFGNHLTGMQQQAPRGGDLCIMNTDGSVRFLTKEAGFGVEDGEIQAENGIAARQPCVHWDGSRALFSMVIGGPIKAYDQSYRNNKWQIYEITNLNDVVAGMTPIIEKIANQPNYNNLSPIYGSDDQILFTSDQPLFNLTHTYPQMDEYESAPTNTGIFKLNPETGKTIHLTHSPSGDFDIHLAKDGRVISTRWEHLKRDQQASNHRAGNTQWQPVNYESESATAAIIKGEPMKDGKPYADVDGTPYEIFPEAFVHIENGINVEPNRDENEPLHDFNEFLPWEITENGERHQTVNHVGRHEFGGVFQHGSKMDDDNLYYGLGDLSANAYRETVGSDAGIFQVKEDPRPGKEGTFYGTWAREFGRFSSGRIFEFALPIGANPQDMEVIDWTNELIDNQANDLGHFRNPTMMMNGTMLVSFAEESNLFGRDYPYTFRISKMVKKSTDVSDTEHIAGEPLAGDVIQREIVYWGDAVAPLSATVEMSEAEIAEIVPRTAPTARPKYEIDPIEKSVLDEEGIDETALRAWMVENNLALIAIRNMTERDAGEQQQPFNLRVPGGVESIPASGKVYDISHLQIFGGEMIRGYGLRNYVGRRTIATPLRNTEANPNIKDVNLFDSSGPESSIKIGIDGSVAAFVPATRALTWQSVSPEGEPIVRERQWITFAPGEIRTCEGCHGINDKSHLGNGAPQNKPEALRALVQSWKNGFEGNNNALGFENAFQTKGGVTLYQNFPNPFKNVTTISFVLNEAKPIRIKIYDMQGKVIKKLLDEKTEKGKHNILWNGKDSTGNGCGSGIYVCEFSDGTTQLYNRIILQ